MKKRFMAVVLAATLALATLVTGCGASDNEVAPTDSEDVAGDVADAVNDVADATDKSVGFVTFGLGGDFFQMLADEFVEVMEADGWEASYADGAFDPTKQIEACENYIAKKVDVIVCWSVAAEAMDGVIAECENQGIKFVAFVAPTSSYDALMISDDATLGRYACKLAAKWIDSHYADAEDHSVPVAVFSCREATTGVLQADELIQIENWSTKAKFVKEVELQSEAVADGMAAAENLFTTDKDIKVILTAHSSIATGVNNYLTSLSSPITDYKDMAIFAINGDNVMADLIKSSVNDECPLRGMVMTGSVNDTAKEIRDVCNGVMDGSLEEGYIQEAGTLFIDADTIDEYLSTGTVSSVTNEDFD